VTHIFKFSSRYDVSIFHVLALLCHKFTRCLCHLKHWYVVVSEQFSPVIKLKWEFNILICQKEQGPFNCTTSYIRSKGLDRSWDSSVGIATDYTGWTAQISFPAVQDFLLHSAQTNSGAHPASYPVGTKGSLPRAKVAGVWSWPLTSMQCQVQESWSCTSTPPHVFRAECLTN
jgi:hypothetical protein